MADNNKKPIVWWIELVRAILATLAGLLGGGAASLL